MQSTAEAGTSATRAGRSDLLARLAELPAPGWYPDPEDLALQRLWSGVRWVGTRRPSESGGDFAFDYVERGPAPALRLAPASPPRRDLSRPPQLGLRNTRVTRNTPWVLGASAVLVAATVSVSHP